MRNGIRRAIGAIVVAAAMLAAPAFGFVVVTTGQNAVPSPTLEALASWTIGESVLTLLDVEKNKTIGTFDAHFIIDGVAFSTSGRFLCVSGLGPDFPVVIVDSQRHFRVTVSQKGGGVTNRYCKRAGGAVGISPTLPLDSRSDSLIPIESYTTEGGSCASTPPPISKYLLQYWDPNGKVGKLAAEYHRVSQGCIY